jgi:hypothetical protein
MEQQDFCKNSFKPDFKQGDRKSEAESEMEMIEAKRERGAAGVETKKIEVR